MKLITFSNKNLFVKLFILSFLLQTKQSYGIFGIRKKISSCCNSFNEWYKHSEIQACKERMNKVYKALNNMKCFEEHAKLVWISLHGPKAVEMRECMLLKSALPFIQQHGGGRNYSNKIIQNINLLTQLLNECKPLYEESIKEFEVLKKTTEQLIDKLTNLENTLTKNKAYFKLQKLYSKLSLIYHYEFLALDRLNHPCKTSISFFISDIKRTTNFCYYNQYPCKSYLHKIETDLNNLQYNINQYSQNLISYPKLTNDLNDLYERLTAIKNLLISDISFNLEYQDELRHEKLYLQEQERIRLERERLHQIEERYCQQREIDRLNRKIDRLETENTISNTISLIDALTRPTKVYVPAKKEIIKEIVYVPVKDEQINQTINIYQTIESDKKEKQNPTITTDDDLPPASDY